MARTINLGEIAWTLSQDDSGFQSTAGAVSERLAEQSRAYAEVTGNMDKYTAGGKNASQSAEELRRRIAELVPQKEKLSQALAATTARYGHNSAEAKNVRGALSALNREIGGMVKAHNQLDGVQKISTKTTYSSRLEWMALQQALQSTAQVFRGVSEAMKRGQREAAAYESSLAGIKTLNVDKDISQIREEVGGLSVEFAQDKQAMVKAYYDAISSGVRESDMVPFLADVSRGATVMQTSIADMNNVVTTALNAYQMETQEASRVTDILFTTVQHGKTTGIELAQSFGQVAAMAAGAQVPLEQVSSMLASATFHGVDTSSAVAGLNAALGNIAKPTAEAAKEAERLGVEFSATAAQAEGLIPFIQGIIDKNQGNQESMVKLFGSIQGVRTVMAAFADGGAKVNETLGDMASANDKVAEAFVEMSKTAEFAMKRADNAAQVFFDEIHAGGLPATALLADIRTAFYDLATTAMQSMPLASETVGTLGVALGGLGGAIGTTAQLAFQANNLWMAYEKIKTVTIIREKAHTAALLLKNAAMGKSLLLAGSSVAIIGASVYAVWKAVEAYQGWREAIDEQRRAEELSNRQMERTIERHHQAEQSTDALKQEQAKLQLQLIGIREEQGKYRQGTEAWIAKDREAQVVAQQLTHVMEQRRQQNEHLATTNTHAAQRIQENERRSAQSTTQWADHTVAQYRRVGAEIDELKRKSDDMAGNSWWVSNNERAAYSSEMMAGSVVDSFRRIMSGMDGLQQSQTATTNNMHIPISVSVQQGQRAMAIDGVNAKLEQALALAGV